MIKVTTAPIQILAEGNAMNCRDRGKWRRIDIGSTSMDALQKFAHAPSTARAFSISLRSKVQLPQIRALRRNRLAKCYVTIRAWASRPSASSASENFFSSFECEQAISLQGER